MRRSLRCQMARFDVHEFGSLRAQLFRSGDEPSLKNRLAVASSRTLRGLFFLPERRLGGGPLSSASPPVKRYQRPMKCDKMIAEFCDGLCRLRPRSQETQENAGVKATVVRQASFGENPPAFVEKGRRTIADKDVAIQATRTEFPVRPRQPACRTFLLLSIRSSALPAFVNSPPVPPSDVSSFPVPRKSDFRSVARSRVLTTSSMNRTRALGEIRKRLIEPPSTRFPTKAVLSPGSHSGGRNECTHRPRPFFPI